MNKYLKANQQLWDELTAYHTDSDYYDLDAFRQGKTSLLPIEVKELGDINNKSLLHLQCHFGLDSISLSRMGATVTGVDFSTKSIKYAKQMAENLKEKVNFVESDVYELTDCLTEQYDIIYTSYGVLCWLSDLKRWAEIINRFLKPGGFFYLCEIHPITYIFDAENKTDELKITYDYFANKEPQYFAPDYDYADQSKMTKNASYEWNHPVSDVVNSLISVGLNIEFLNEHAESCYQQFSRMKKRTDRLWQWENNLHKKLPMLFSLKAVKK